jgi:hypothetical protein
LLVDHTPAPPKDTLPLGTVTDDITKALGLRPTWAMYSRAQAINWRTGRVNNETRLTMIVFHECADVETGSFGIKTVHRYRVLRLEDGVATWTLYEQTKTDAMSADAFAVVGSGTFTNRVGKAADFLPVAIGYTGRTDAPLCSTIPLLGVAWANLAHWQLSTTLRFSAEVAGYAQGVIVGDIAQEQGANGQMVPGKVRMGPLTLIHLKGDNASFEWKAPPVEAFAPLEVRIAEKLEQMGQMGMSFLTPDKRAAETVAAKRLDATAEFSTLATSAQGIEDAVNAAWEFTGWYLGIEKAGCPVTTINTDFEAITIEADVMGAYAQLIDKGYPKRLVKRRTTRRFRRLPSPCTRSSYRTTAIRAPMDGCSSRCQRAAWRICSRSRTAKAGPERRDRKAIRVIPAILAQRVLPDQQDRREPLAPREAQDRRAPKAFRA